MSVAARVPTLENTLTVAMSRCRDAAVGGRYTKYGGPRLVTLQRFD